jgi:hypothetical protein
MLETGTETKNIFRQYKSRLLDSFYRSMLEVLNQKEIIQQSKKFEVLSFALCYFLLYFQFTSLMWRPSMPITSWSSYEKYWQILSYTRIDPLIHASGALSIFYYLLSSLVYFTFFLFLLIFIFSVKKKEPGKFVKYLEGKLLKIQTSVLLIPILTIFSINLSQSVHFQQFYLNEEQVSWSKMSKVNSIICLVLHVFHAVSYEYMAYEIRHSYFNKNFQAKATASTDIKRIISRIIIIQMYCYFPVSSITWVHLLSALVCFWLGSMYLIYIPYYNKLANCIVLTKISCEFSITLIFVIGKYFDSAGFILISSLCITPLFICISPQFLDWRYSKIPSNPDQISNEYLFEVYLRPTLCKTENGSLKTIEILNSYSRKKDFNNLGLIGIWECNYCLYALNDIRLAYLKLYKTSTCSFSLERSFQEFKCRKLLKENSGNSIEDMSFLRYVLKLSKAKDYDKTLCQFYISFAAEMVSASPSIVKLENCVKVLYSRLKFLKTAYENLCLKYPKGKECRKLWVSFNEDIYHADGFALGRIKYQSTQRAPNDLNYFDEKNGVLLISAEKHSIGTVVYVNEQFCRIIGGTSALLVNSHVNDLIPEMFTHRHNQIILNFANYCTSSVLDVPFSLFLQNERGFLVECFLNISCTSIGFNRYYLTTVKKVENSRQMVLLDQHGQIFAHTENFKHFVQTFNTILKNSLLSSLLPGVNFEEMTENEPVEKDLNGLRFVMVKSVKRLRNTCINVLTFFDDMTGYFEMMSQSAKDKNEKANIYQKIKSYSIGKSKVRFDQGKGKDDKVNSTNFPVNTEEKQQDDEKSKGDSTSKEDSIVLGMVRGLAVAIRNLQLIKWMIILVVRFK